MCGEQAKAHNAILRFCNNILISTRRYLLYPVIDLNLSSEASHYYLNGEFYILCGNFGEIVAFC